ncbi:NAD(P)-binding protein [Marinomonas balearica]|uniref:Flavin-dependent amine oxidoreductase n=1 Tax=Marinomonas balearica TaxID=491947 RepID=A0A4R6M7T4_9GAMM|nr:NAD(P)-binding protein [Marinomonas balearica]TDO97477.1 flavin-dependent amine oxidoreductase [Marinomonas balearica]
MHSLNQNTPEKIAILGGGVSAITTAFRLTREDNWQEKYDITIYQLGWRNGGKGASGRNMEEHARIEEHGIHVWFGFYQNSIKFMRECYEELNRNSGPMQTFDEAFVPHNSTAMAQYYKDEWIPWVLDLEAFFDNSSQVNDDTSFAEKIVQIIQQFFSPLKNTLDSHPKFDSLISVIEQAETQFERFEDNVDNTTDTGLVDILIDLRKTLEEVCEKAENLLPLLKNPVLRLMLSKRLGIDITKHDVSEAELCVTRLWLMADFGLTLAIGMFKDGGEHDHYDHLNNIEFADWMKNHGASEDTLNGPFLKTVYCGFFAYKDGDVNQPNLETGTFLNAVIYGATHGNGTFVYRMHAGMGDVVFGPYYQVLNQIGVKFKFFHNVQELVAGTDASGNPIVEKIKIAKQVELKDESKGYDPLVDVKGLPCWPSTPRYEQIEDDIAEKLIAHNIDLESMWTNWPEIYNQPQIELVAGVDFDRVVLGMSVASIPYVAPSLLEKSPKMAQMTEKVEAVCTQAFQLWFNKDVKELGWPAYKKGSLEPEWLGYATQQVDNWASVSYLTKVEDWPVDATPKNISYFCGTFTPTTPAPDAPNPQYPIDQKASVKQLTKTMMTERFHPFMNNANPKPGEFEWNWLSDTSESTGESRFDSQYWRSNIDPSERYVQAITGTTQYRLKTDESGFDNLLLTGDWIQNGFNMGCVESATLSGMQTADAIINPKK